MILLYITLACFLLISLIFIALIAKSDKPQKKSKTGTKLYFNFGTRGNTRAILGRIESESTLRKKREILNSSESKF